MIQDEPLRQVLRLTGGSSALARSLGLVPSAVTQWPRVPARWLPRIAQMTKLPPEHLRPDLYQQPGVE